MRGDGHDSAAAKATLSSRMITVSALSLHETSYLLRKTAEELVANTRKVLWPAVKKALTDPINQPRSTAMRKLLAQQAAVPVGCVNNDQISPWV